jgi:zinc-binding in reverse transcriptase
MFSTNFVYQICNDPCVPKPGFRQVWRTQEPPRVHFFLWLLLHDKLNTAANLQKKGCSAMASCVLCSSNVMESAAYLFSNCPTTTHILLSTISTPHHNKKVNDTWTSIGGTRERQRWASTMWTIWKERNARIFQQHARSNDVLIHEAREQAALWTTAYQQDATNTTSRQLELFSH